MTYLELVNDVLNRLRESSVATVTETDYSSLIGKFVNDAKKQVEDAWRWNVLNTTIIVNTSAGVSQYTVTGSGKRFSVVSVNDTTNKGILFPMPISQIRDAQQLSTISNGVPGNYAFNGETGGNSNVELFPTPNGTYAIKFNLFVPQADLSTGSTELLVPSEPVVAFAYARALVERGEDGGLSSSEAYGLARSILSDAIAIESNRGIENDIWIPV